MRATVRTIDAQVVHGRQRRLLHQAELVVLVRHRGLGAGHLVPRREAPAHYYDGNDNGTPKPGINLLDWSSGWPVAH
ncbi:hypothetical protein ACWET9_03555 [Streptomyces sp. NPDC004059]